MYVLSETVFEDWVTFQYHEDATLNRLETSHQTRDNPSFGGPPLKLGIQISPK
jgi:hypothetical protein